jgi:hypothetical protein
MEATGRSLAGARLPGGYKFIAFQLIFLKVNPTKPEKCL